MTTRPAFRHSAPRRVRARRIGLGLLAAALALAPAGSARAKKEKPAKASEQKAEKSTGPATWYAQRITHGDAPLAVEQFWSKGRKLRAEIVVQGMPVRTFVNGDFYTIVDVQNLVGISIHRAPAAIAVDRANPNERPFGQEWKDLEAQGAEMVRSDNVLGQPCRVYRITDDRGKREVWVTDDKRKLPLRVQFFSRASGAESTTEYIDWLSNLRLTDSFFEPDPRVKLEVLQYEDYVKRSHEGPVGPAPVLFSELLHGR